jgi:hypothetical protein
VVTSPVRFTPPLSVECSGMAIDHSVIPSDRMVRTPGWAASELLRTPFGRSSSQERYPCRGAQRRLRKGDRVERGSRNGPAPPPRSAGPPQWHIVSGALGSVHASFGPWQPARAEAAYEKGRRPRRGEIQAAGPGNSSLPGCVQAKHRGRTSQKNPSTHSAE